MKKTLLLFCLLASTTIYAQTENPNIKQVATSWIDALFNFDFDEAKKFSTEETVAILESMEKDIEIKSEEFPVIELPSSISEYKILDELTYVSDRQARLQVNIISAVLKNTDKLVLPLDLAYLKGHWLVDLDMEALGETIEEFEKQNKGMFDNTRNIDAEAVDEVMEAAEDAKMNARKALEVAISEDYLMEEEPEMQAIDSDEEFPDESYFQEPMVSSAEMFKNLPAKAQSNPAKDEEAMLDIPEVLQVSKSWLQAYLTFDIATAIKYSTDETQQFMEMIQTAIEVNPISDSAYTTLKKIKIEIDPKDIVLKGDMARVKYKRSLPEDLKSSESSIYLKKIDNQWLVQYNMLDAISENQTLGESSIKE